MDADVSSPPPVETVSQPTFSVVVSKTRSADARSSGINDTTHPKAFVPRLTALETLQSKTSASQFESTSGGARQPKRETVTLHRTSVQFLRQPQPFVSTFCDSWSHSISGPYLVQGTAWLANHGRNQQDLCLIEQHKRLHSNVRPCQLKSECGVLL